jgi:hypothetical protein
MNEVLFTVFLIALGIAPQKPTPPDQALRQSASRSAPVKIIGSPTLVPVQSVPSLLPRLQLEPAGLTSFLLRPMSEMEKDL